MDTGITVEVERDGERQRVDATELTDVELHSVFAETGRDVLESLVISLARWVRDNINVQETPNATGAHYNVRLTMPDDDVPEPAHAVVLSLCDQFNLPPILPLLLFAVIEKCGGDFERPVGGGELLSRVPELQRLIPGMKNLTISSTPREDVAEAGDKQM